MEALGLIPNIKELPDKEKDQELTLIFGNPNYQYIWVHDSFSGDMKLAKKQGNYTEQQRLNYLNYPTWACAEPVIFDKFLKSDLVGEKTFVITGGKHTPNIIKMVKDHNTMGKNKILGIAIYTSQDYEKMNIETQQKDPDLIIAVATRP